MTWTSHTRPYRDLSAYDSTKKSVGDFVRAGCGDKPHVRFGRGRLMPLHHQGLASYLTSDLRRAEHMAKGDREFRLTSAGRYS